MLAEKINKRKIKKDIVNQMIKLKKAKKTQQKKKIENKVSIKNLEIINFHNQNYFKIYCINTKNNFR